MLPLHWVNDGVGRLDARRESRELAGFHDDPPLVQHRGEDDDHVVGVHGVVVL